MRKPLVNYRPPRPGDAEHVLRHLRAADLAECQAAGHDPADSLAHGLRHSLLAWTGTVDDEPALAMGCVPMGSLLSGVGVPWLLGTDLVPRHGRAFMRPAPRYIAEMLGMFPHLLNFVHAENRVAVGWLRHMGFRIHEAAPYGPHGAAFHLFEAYRDV